MQACKFKSFDLRNHFSYPLDIDIFNRGDIEIFGQYIIQEKLRWKIVKKDNTQQSGKKYSFRYLTLSRLSASSQKKLRDNFIGNPIFIFVAKYCLEKTKSSVIVSP